jgi:hypothetical protein
MSENHGDHAYEFKIGERGDWASGLTEVVYYELKAEFRAQLQKLLDGAPGPWCYELKELVRRYRVGSLHAIGDDVHRELLQGWLDGINRKRASCDQLFLPRELLRCCEYVPPHLWHACVEARLRIGSDLGSAKDWEIDVFAPNAKVRRPIPVYAGVSWTCEITHDGRNQMTYRKLRNKDAWHWCTNCTSWPKVNYEDSTTKPDKGIFCAECQEKEKAGTCVPA